MPRLDLYRFGMTFNRWESTGTWLPRSMCNARMTRGRPGIQRYTKTKWAIMSFSARSATPGTLEVLIKHFLPIEFCDGIFDSRTGALVPHLTAGLLVAATGVCMANRPVYIPGLKGQALVTPVSVEFKWVAGMAVTQKQKPIRALHEAAAKRNISRVLEISSKSEEFSGRKARVRSTCHL